MLFIELVVWGMLAHSSNLRSPSFQSTTSSYESLFPHPTGQNGLEEYARASDALKGYEFGVYQSWLPPEKRPTPEQLRQEEAEDKKLLDEFIASKKGAGVANVDPQVASGLGLDDRPDRVRAALEAHANQLSFLQVKQEEITRFHDVLDLVAQGNLKPFYWPNDRARDFVFAVNLKTIAKLSIDAAFVEFASGHSRRAVDILCETLKMSHRYDSGNLICELVATAVRAIVCSSLNEHLDALSYSDTSEIANLAGALLDDKSVLLGMVDGEHQQATIGMSEIMRDLSAHANDASDPLGSAFAKLSSADQAIWENRIVKSIEQSFEEVRIKIAADEATWLDNLVPDMDPSPKDDEPDKPLRTLEDLAKVLDSAGTSFKGQSFWQSLLINRTQLRLLRLHMRIIRFRWENDRLPTTIDEMKLPHEETEDPLSHKPFKYVVSKDKYTLSSLGNARTGEVLLKYRHPKTLDSTDSGNP